MMGYITMYNKSLIVTMSPYSELYSSSNSTYNPSIEKIFGILITQRSGISTSILNAFYISPYFFILV